MGKIRIKVLGDEEQEQKKQKEAKIKKEQKEARKAAQTPVAEKEEEKVEEVKKEVKKPKTAAKKRTRSKNYQTRAALVENGKTYNLSVALKLLEQLKRAKFDETVELHINANDALFGSLTLPHGSGKQTKVAIADDKLIADVEKGNITFDVLLATPQMMPKLAKVARFLGPRGLMPNPKSGTITDKPEEAVKKFQSGLVNYKSESKTPIVHFSVGKLSFGDKKLAENINVVLATINAAKIKNVTLKSTMSPGIKIQI